MNITSPRTTISSMTSETMPRPAAGALLDKLLELKVIRPRDWTQLPLADRGALERQVDLTSLLQLLEELKLITEYQAARISVGGLDELVIGNYRVTDFLGAGGMGMVVQAEHYLFRKPVAIKILTTPRSADPRALERFLNEIWIVGQLQHPNIVTAIDAGETEPPDLQTAPRYYLVMEYVPGFNLEELVQRQGPLDPAIACDIAYQIADALTEAEKHHLVHRDIKPSNVRMTPEERAKLLDFGVARVVERRMTTPGQMLGSLGYLAPEQAQDASSADIRADIYGLGGVLYWCLTGRPPFEGGGNPAVELARRSQQPAPRLRQHRSQVSDTLEQLVMSMMAPDRDQRPASPKIVQQALTPFLKKRSMATLLRESTSAFLASEPAAPPGSHRILIVDDEATNRNVWRLMLEGQGYLCDEAANGLQALGAFQSNRYDLVLLDIDMPIINGIEVLSRLREAPPVPHLKILMVSGRATGDDMAKLLLAGADDFLTKPFTLTQLQARVKTALRQKDAQSCSDALFRNLLTANHEQAQNLLLRDSDLIQARSAMVTALAELVAQRDTETGAHLMRLQRFSRCLAEAACSSPAYSEVIDEQWIAMLECCAPLHDIGKAGVPDHILLKAGPLTPEERIIMQTHTTVGANILEKVAREHGFAKPFMKMATDVTRHHHERFDGKGYPDRLIGDAIPLAARIVAFADVYDALRSRRVYKPALPHGEVVRIMVQESHGHFDPALIPFFEQCAGQFDKLYRELAD